MVTLQNRADERYLELVRLCPFRPLRDGAQLRRAIEVIDMLLDLPELSEAEADYLDVLSDLVERYEQNQAVLPPVSGGAALRHLMEEHNLRQQALVPLFGSKSIVSEVLNGKRSLALRHIQNLSRYFGVPADVFLDG